jgi:hypothetical protein
MSTKIEAEMSQPRSAEERICKAARHLHGLKCCLVPPRFRAEPSAESKIMNKNKHTMKTNLFCSNHEAGRTVLPVGGTHGVTCRAGFALLTAAALFTHDAFAGNPPTPPPPPPSSGTLALDYSTGGNGSENFGLAVSSSGAVYSSGTSYFPDYGPNTWHGIVLASGDGGGNWTTVLDDAPPGFSVGFSGGIASDASGKLYVAGVSFDSTGEGTDHWTVLRSIDGGVIWATADDLDTGGYSGSDPVTGITVNSDGDVYVTGTSFVAGKLTWTIRKGAGGTSFSTVDLVTGSSPSAVFAHPTAGIFAVGTKTVVTKGKTTNVWLVRRSTNGGVTWSDVDTFQLSSGNGAHANGICADALGNLYVVGRGTTTSQGNNIYHWVVRRSTDGGNSWSTADDFVPSSKSGEARCVVATQNGDLYVAGIGTTSAGNHWILRKKPGAAGTWTTIDDYQFVPGSTTEPRSMAADNLGNLFVGGFGWGPSGGGTHWLIKKY